MIDQCIFIDSPFTFYYGTTEGFYLGVPFGEWSEIGMLHYLSCRLLQGIELYFVRIIISSLFSEWIFSRQGQDPFFRTGCKGTSLYYVEQINSCKIFEDFSPKRCECYWRTSPFFKADGKNKTTSITSKLFTCILFTVATHFHSHF